MAVVSKVIIANMALANVGARNSIESLTEESVEAKAVNLWYDFSRVLILEGYDWNFARKRLTLAEHTEAPPDNIWSYRYTYPADCVNMRKLQQPDFTTNPLFANTYLTLSEPDAIPFDIEMNSTGNTKTILTDLEDAIAVYTFDQQDVNLFSLHFVQTLAYALGYNIAYQLTGKRSVQETMFNAYNIMLGNAAMKDANEHVDRKPREAEGIRARS